MIDLLLLLSWPLLIPLVVFCGLRHPSATLALIAVLLVAACTPPPTDSLCVVTGPIYLRDGAIDALRGWRDERVAIASHNAVWERSCRH